MQKTSAVIAKDNAYTILRVEVSRSKHRTVSILLPSSLFLIMHNVLLESQLQCLNVLWNLPRKLSGLCNRKHNHQRPAVPFALHQTNHNRSYNNCVYNVRTGNHSSAICQNKIKVIKLKCLKFCQLAQPMFTKLIVVYIQLVLLNARVTVVSRPTN